MATKATLEDLKFRFGPFESLVVAIESAIRDALEITSLPISVELPPKAEFGDLAIPLHQIRKQLGKAFDTQRDVIMDAVKALPEIAGVSVEGAFLNLRLDKYWLASEVLKTVLTTESYGDNKFGSGRVMVEYSSPNTNKALHIGHMRNNVLGVAVSRILAASHFTVITSCLVNDRGIHICKSMLMYEKEGNGSTPESTGIKGDKFVGGFYERFEQCQQEERQVYARENGIDLESPSQEGGAKEEREARQKKEKEFEKAFLEKSTLQQEAQSLLQRWEQGDPEARSLWEQMNQWFYDGTAVTYQKFGSHFDHTYLESDTYLLGKDIIDEGLAKGVFRKRDDGAVVFDYHDMDTKKTREKVFLRSDGTSVYISQDLGTAVKKAEDCQLDRSVYVVANEQSDHFKILFSALKELGYPWAKYLYHLAYGMVDLLTDGERRKMSSRRGDVVGADELILELEQKAAAKLGEHSPGKVVLSADELNHRAEYIAGSAFKFYFLKVPAVSRMAFDPEASLDFHGDTGPYCLYTLARLHSIFDKVGESSVEPAHLELLIEPLELAIITQLGMFPGMIAQSAQSYDPSILAGYILELCQLTNLWYEDRNHQVVGGGSADLTLARLGLLRAVALVLQRGLNLLGIKTLAKM